MEAQANGSPMTKRQLIDEYFIENRTRLLDLAAFLDRLDRASDPAGEPDFRMEAFEEALAIVGRGATGRVLGVQMVFSDPTTEPLQKLDQKSARGAYDRRREEAR